MVNFKMPNDQSQLQCIPNISDIIQCFSFFFFFVFVFFFFQSEVYTLTHHIHSSILSPKPFYHQSRPFLRMFAKWLSSRTAVHIQISQQLAFLYYTARLCLSFYFVVVAFCVRYGMGDKNNYCIGCHSRRRWTLRIENDMNVVKFELRCIDHMNIIALKKKIEEEQLKT